MLKITLKQLFILEIKSYKILKIEWNFFQHHIFCKYFYEVKDKFIMEKHASHYSKQKLNSLIFI